MRNGLFVQAAYTAARDRGFTAEWSQTVENAFDLGREDGRDQATPAHRLTTALMYELPFGENRRWLNRLPKAFDLAVGGWQLSAVGYLQSGLFLTPTVTLPDPTGTRFTSGANRPNVTLRPDQLRDAALSDPSINQWFDPTAFGVPGLGQFGSASRGSIEGPGLNVWHVGLHKIFRVSDRPSTPSFRLELTSTNFFNHNQWANPNVNVTSTNVSAAKITGVGGPTSFQQAGARTFRLGLRAEW